MIVTEVRTGGARMDTNGFNPTVAAVLAHEAALGVTLDGGLFKSGEGTLTLGGANTYTGGTTVAAGAVTLSNTTAAGAGAITLGIFTGASNLRLTFSAANVANNITVAAAGAGTVTLYGNSQFSGHGGHRRAEPRRQPRIPATGAATDWWYAFNGVISGAGQLAVRGGSGGTSAASLGNRIMVGGRKTTPAAAPSWNPANCSSRMLRPPVRGHYAGQRHDRNGRHPVARRRQHPQHHCRIVRGPFFAGGYCHLQQSPGAVRPFADRPGAGDQRRVRPPDLVRRGRDLVRCRQHHHRDGPGRQPSCHP